MSAPNRVGKSKNGGVPDHLIGIAIRKRFLFRYGKAPVLVNEATDNCLRLSPKVEKGLRAE
ncbi:hypothetical protein COY62_02330 [bacterium (Candidatus Howlettbacteria) CG_4_10_14_0_8_um_filter_40_9]|nr:MAG: hypothetical protein COY62_02330 [bacterium (Candidatus Howlettbacteria) CG_4_10_14_0_8_um_filter_40_9]